VKFSGEVHPAAARYPMLDADDLQALAEDIAANGLRDPLTLDATGTLLDGRNRLAACTLAGVEPTFVVLPDGEDAAAFILSRNVERRHMGPGQRAMARALDLADAGHRRNGRWARETLSDGIPSDRVSVSSWHDLMAKAGRVIDAAARWPEILGDLPVLVLRAEKSLDAAYREAADTESAQAVADLKLHRPVREWLTEIDGLSLELEKDATTRLPKPLAPIHRDDQRRFESIAKAIRASLRTIDEFIKTNGEGTTTP